MERDQVILSFLDLFLDVIRGQLRVLLEKVLEPLHGDLVIGAEERHDFHEVIGGVGVDSALEADLGEVVHSCIAPSLIHDLAFDQQDHPVKDLVDIRTRLMDREDDALPLLRELSQLHNDNEGREGVQPGGGLVEEHEHRVAYELEAD